MKVTLKRKGETDNKHNKQVNSAHPIKFLVAQWRSIKLIMRMGKLSRAGDTVISKGWLKRLHQGDIEAPKGGMRG